MYLRKTNEIPQTATGDRPYCRVAKDKTQNKKHYT